MNSNVVPVPLHHPANPQQVQQQQQHGKQVASTDGVSSRRQLLLGFSAASLAAALGASLPQASNAGAIGDSIKGVLLRARVGCSSRSTQQQQLEARVSLIHRRA